MSTLRTKDERGEGPLRDSPFIQDAPIPSHFRLPMLEAYDGSSDPTEHVTKEEEHLGQYLIHFTDEVRVIPDMHPTLVIQAFMIGIRPSCLFWSLVERPPTTVPKMLQRVNQYVAAEILVAEKREDQKRPWAEPSRGPPFGVPRRRMERGEQTIPRSPNIPLNSTQTEIFLQI
ncbi:hypothetical protein B296_00012018 [Ensete ventricosum]|uniref:Retrotransposon gag domain-containing protein n=1 Tax=Ensete ventricosum TaxID=4639 RepID=A0A427APL1_ENSVE|nr:hypothetical protein B296_00012018 [Ensete ventricosum]